jgi:hypothetical protein
MRKEDPFPDLAPADQVRKRRESMSVRWVRRGTALFFLLFVLAVTWPGMLHFNRIHPLVLGLPLSMFWIALWVVCSFLILLLVDVVEGKTRKADD